MKKETAEKILNETEQGYDLIAGKFSETRKHFWRGLEFIGDYAKKGNVVLDFGCGNGRLLELIGNNENIEYYGVDISGKLIDTAKGKYPDRSFLKISPIQSTLAFNDDYFNTIYSIAVFHHFPSKKYREDWVKELYRVSKKDGWIIVTVWNLYQKKYIKNILRSWLLKIAGISMPPHQLADSVSRLYFFEKCKFFLKQSVLFNGSWCGGEDWNDCYISFTDNSGNKFQRFHHAFTKRELRKLFASAGFFVEKCEIINGRNILLVCRK